MLNCDNQDVQINDRVLDVDDINEDTPDGTRFMRNGKMYRITRADVKCCEMYECGEACQFYNVCENLPFGFEIVR